MIRKISDNEQKKMWLAGTTVFILLVIWIMIAPNGAIKYYRVNKELGVVHARNQELTAENEALKEEIGKLKNDPAYIQEIARKKYGMIKKNEIVFEFKPKKKKHH